MESVTDKINEAALSAAPLDTDFNRRFVAALNGLGLYLSWWPEGSVPDDAVMVPMPWSAGWQYQYPAYVTTS